MIITMTQIRCIGNAEIKVTDTVTVEIQNRESIDTALDILWKFKGQWDRNDRLQEAQELDDGD